MKLYISGAISSDLNWYEKFSNAEKRLQERYDDAIIFNPILTSKYADKISYEDFMTIDMAIIDVCDTIFLLKDWKESKGAVREYHYALSKNKNIIMEENIVW